jgi:hypothetical protein
MQVHRMLENGFQQVEVAPQPGATTRINCSMPHPAGTIISAPRINANANQLSSSLTLPPCLPILALQPSFVHCPSKKACSQ